MTYVKAAAVVAGSLMALGAAVSPAHASDNSPSGGSAPQNGVSSSLTGSSPLEAAGLKSIVGTLQKALPLGALPLG